MVQIIEILGRSKQGATKPYICRGDDDHTYFVKGIGAGRASQIYEWLTGNLAVALNLPIAPFEIVDVPMELIDGDPGYYELGHGPAFGSQKQTLMELSFSAVNAVPVELQRDVLAFDWWIHNDDRKLTEKGGNPNLFWQPEEERLVVIDHNLAFDPKFSADTFCEYHVFSGAGRTLFEDALYRQYYTERFQAALGQWHNIRAKVPEEWMFADYEQTIQAGVDLDAIFNLLNRCNSDELWEGQ